MVQRGRCRQRPCMQWCICVDVVVHARVRWVGYKKGEYDVSPLCVVRAGDRNKWMGTGIFFKSFGLNAISSQLDATIAILRALLPPWFQPSLVPPESVLIQLRNILIVVSWWWKHMPSKFDI